MKGTPERRIAAIARGFVLLALGGPILWARDADAVFILAALGIWWFSVAVTEARWRITGTLLGLLDGAFVGALCAVSLDSSAILGALVVPPFVAGLRSGVRGLGLVLSAELTVVVAATLLITGQPTTAQSLDIFTWVVMGLALGLVGTFARGTFVEDDPLAPYRHASDLLRELNDLTAGLSSGLDPRALGGQILSEVRDQLPTAALALYVVDQGDLTPLVTKELGDGDVEQCESIAGVAWSLDRVVLEDSAFALPLDGRHGSIAIVAGTLSSAAQISRSELRSHVETLSRQLLVPVVHLETGLLFATFRDAATADERRRLSREMHDGVAQDIASLGYLVDALAAKPASPEQAERFELLRERVTAIVAEVRRSVMSLRTTVGSSESLGTAILGVTRNLSQVSGLPIEVTLDEQPQRLRPEVEGELFRITQEALNNAVKHARCQSIRVHCQIAPPAATITIRDDGRGLGVARDDSYGLGIMRERARLVGADLLFEEPADGGLLVTVRLGADGSDTPRPPTQMTVTS
jgi:signal transduction histidine kinase